MENQRDKLVLPTDACIGWPFARSAGSNLGRFGCAAYFDRIAAGISEAATGLLQA
jgi:hypothetical protein